jgi:MinD superfamily P-loop ATPase
MLVCWSAKGGSGATVVAAGIALAASARAPVTLVDLGGDLPAALGADDPPGPGIVEWLGSAEADGAALRRCEVTVAAGVTLLARGGARRPDDVTVPEHAWRRLVTALARHAVVVVDAGTGPPPVALAEAADQRVLVTRACFLSLRRAAGGTAAPTAVVLVDEPGRVLRVGDVQRAIGAPVAARVPWDPAIARAVDAGLLAGRPPRSLLQPLRRFS